MVDPIDNLSRGDRVYLNVRSFHLTEGWYTVAAVRPQYVKFRQGSGAVKELKREKFRAIWDVDPPGDPIRPSDGVLSALGYRVGREGIPASARRRILVDALVKPLKSLPPVSNVQDWRKQSSQERFAKLLRTLGGLAFQAERRSGSADFQSAIADWKNDQDWVKDTFGKSYASGQLDHIRLESYGVQDENGHREDEGPEIVDPLLRLLME